MKQEAALVWCPLPDRESARTISGELLSEKLIACANIIGDIESVFEWEGRRDSGKEVAVLFKTTAVLADTMISRLGELHPYDTPAIIGWKSDFIHSATLGWLNEQLP